MPLYYFGRDLVLFRGADGAPRVLDAYCPHLGAHLAVGGRVEDDCIRARSTGGSSPATTGRCVEVPYDEVELHPAQGARPQPTRRSSATR